jgi:hypothetical protein
MENSRTIIQCENCDAVHIVKMTKLINNEKCPICNGDLISLDGIQSVINAILRDKTISILYSQETEREVISRPYFGWGVDGYKELKKEYCE